MDSPAEPTHSQTRAGLLAAVVVGLETLALAGFALFYAWELVAGQGSDPIVVLMSIVLFLVFVVGFGYVAYGLWRRHPRAQAPAIAANGLLVPLGIAMFQFAPIWLAGGVLALGLVVVVATVRMGSLD